MVVSRIPGHLTWAKEPGSTGGLKFPTMPGDEEIKRFQGDGLNLRMDSNHRILEITGDGCRINLTKNCGSVRVLGDGCSVKIGQNVGDIIYKGDGGRVLLGPDSSKGNVKYFGDGGKISFDSSPRQTRSKSKPKNTENFSSNSSKTIINKNLSSRKSTSRNQTIDPYFERTKQDEEEIQNLKNERREVRQSIRRARNKDETGKSGETVIVTTKIMTTTEKDDVVRKWFVSPPVVKSSNENHSIKINKTVIKNVK